jgi:hypothetical protein
MIRLDPRLALLRRAGAWLKLIEPGFASLDEAFADLIDGLERCPLCGLRRHLLAEQWERTHPPLRRRGGAP